MRSPRDALDKCGPPPNCGTDSSPTLLPKREPMSAVMEGLTRQGVVATEDEVASFAVSSRVR